MENKKEIKRLIVCEYENAAEWTKNKKSMLESIKENDFYLVFESGKHVIPTPSIQKLVMDIEKKEFLDATELNDEDYEIFILQKIQQYTSSGTVVYFLSMDEMYDKLKDKIKGAYGVQRADSYAGLGRPRAKKPSGGLMSGFKKNGKKEKKREPSNPEENSFIFAAMSTEFAGIEQINPGINMPEQGIVDDSPVEEMPPVEEMKGNNGKNSEKVPEPEKKHKQNGKPERKKTSKNVKKEKEREEVPPDDDIPWADEGEEPKEPSVKEEKLQEDIQKTINSGKNDVKKDIPPKPQQPKPKPQQQPIEDRYQGGSAGGRNPNATMGNAAMGSAAMGSPRQNQGQGRGQNRNQKGQQGGGRRGQQVQQPQQSYEDCTIQELEKVIFGTKQEYASFEKEYTEVDDGKANIVSLLLDRLIQNIQKLSKNVMNYNLEHKDYIQLITLIVKANDYNDFQLSWEVAQPGSPLGIDESTYNYLKDEALYYSNVCEMLYEKDNWA